MCKYILPGMYIYTIYRCDDGESCCEVNGDAECCSTSVVGLVIG